MIAKLAKKLEKEKQTCKFNTMGGFVGGCPDCGHVLE